MFAASRRQFLRRASALFLAGSAGGWVLRWPGSGPGEVGDDLGSMRLLGDLFRDLEKARSLGRRYLASHPEAEAGARRLAELLLRVGPSGRAELARLLERRRQRDFERDRVVVLRGWVVAETEAQMCALTVLSRVLA
jgi:hypothetical protein